MKSKAEQKSKLFNSFFEDPFQTATFWSKRKSSTLKFEFVTQLLKKNKTKNVFKPKYYAIQEDKLIQLTDSSMKEKQFIDVNNAILSKMQVSSSNEVKFGFRIQKGSNYVEFYHSDELTIGIWYRALKKYCIQINFNENYTATKIIGKGNFAQVYSITRKGDGQQFAAKVFEKSKLEDVNVERNAMEKELRILRSLNHPNIIRLYEVYENANFIFFVCEKLEGGELFQHLRLSRMGYSEQYVQQIMYRLLSAIAYIHASGILHRDIKPENIILRSLVNEFDIVIADFGLADHYHPDAEYAFKRCGTPGYVAPEILQDRNYDYKVDLFSAGVLMYIMVFGQLPFQSEDYNEIIVKNYNCNIDFDAFLPQVQLTDKAVQVLKALLAKDPRDRPTAQQILQFAWFQDFVYMMQLLQQQQLMFQFDYPQFLPQQSVQGLATSQPLMNQQLSISLSQNPFASSQGHTPNNRSNQSNKSSEDLKSHELISTRLKTNTGSHTQQQKQSIFCQKIEEEEQQDDQFEIEHEEEHVQSLQGYQLSKKMKNRLQ